MKVYVVLVFNLYVSKKFVSNKVYYFFLHFKLLENERCKHNKIKKLFIFTTIRNYILNSIYGRSN